MVVIAEADLGYAVVGWLRTFTAEWHALGLDSVSGWKKPPDPSQQRSGPRISNRRQGGDNGWNLPTRAIVVRKAGGPIIGDDYALGIHTSRIDTLSYGGTGAEADGVWAMLHAILVPRQGVRFASFTLNGVTVSDIRPEVGASALEDPVTGWPYTLAPFMVTWRSL